MQAPAMSPRSSAGVRSSHGSDNTLLTVYSPAMTRSAQKAPANAPSGAAVYGGTPLRLSSSASASVGQPASAIDYGVVSQPVPRGPGFTSEANPAITPRIFTRYILVEPSREFSMSAIMKALPIFDHAMPFPKNGHGTYVRFDNLAHVNDGIVMIQRYNLGVRFCTPIEFFSAQYPHAQDLQAINVHEGQVRIFVRVIGSPDAVVFIEDYVKRAAKHFGVVHTLAGPQHVAAFEDSYVLSWRIEFASVMDAMCCVKCFDMAMFANEPISCGACTFLLMRAEMWSPVSTYERQLAGVYSRAMGLENRMAATADPTVGYPEHIMADHSRNNNVVRARILKGQDVRTTIMMRNIPSKMDWMTLKSIVDKYCFGEYDFFYLRIDFSSGSNVGYGFINFSEAMGVLKMVDNLAGRRLPGFHSSRELQISYATIQGKESLINKFRNSSVMYEAPYCKPRLFVPHADMTASVFSIGKEVLFPLPDNASKLQRSIHSARNVGLYPPHGTAGGGDHRDRRSMFDRGTPRDALVQSSQGEAHHAVYDLLPLWKRENLEAAYFQETGVWTVFRSIPQAFLESREGAPRPQRPRPAVVGGSSSSGPLGPIGGPVFAPAGAVPAPVQTGSALGRAAQRQI